jgi:hypothetical protein
MILERVYKEGAIGTGRGRIYIFLKCYVRQISPLNCVIL